MSYFYEEQKKIKPIAFNYGELCYNTKGDILTQIFKDNFKMLFKEYHIDNIASALAMDENLREDLKILLNDYEHEVLSEHYEDYFRLEG